MMFRGYNPTQAEIAGLQWSASNGGRLHPDLLREILAEEAAERAARAQKEQDLAA